MCAKIHAFIIICTILSCISIICWTSSSSQGYSSSMCMLSYLWLNSFSIFFLVFMEDSNLCFHFLIANLLQALWEMWQWHSDVLTALKTQTLLPESSWANIEQVVWAGARVQSRWEMCYLSAYRHIPAQDMPQRAPPPSQECNMMATKAFNNLWIGKTFWHKADQRPGPPKATVSVSVCFSILCVTRILCTHFTVKWLGGKPDRRMDGHGLLCPQLIMTWQRQNNDA